MEVVVVAEVLTGEYIAAGVGVSSAQCHAVMGIEHCNVVAYLIFTPEMLVETFAGAVVANVVFNDNVGRSFIRVVSPAAVLVAGDVVRIVVVEACSRLDPQQVGNLPESTLHSRVPVQRWIS